MDIILNPKTPPPDKNKPYLAVRGPDGKEQWLLLSSDNQDGVTAADFDFEQGKKWAAEQRKAGKGK